MSCDCNKGHFRWGSPWPPSDQLLFGEVVSCFLDTEERGTGVQRGPVLRVPSSMVSGKRDRQGDGGLLTDRASWVVGGEGVCLLL